MGNKFACADPKSIFRGGPTLSTFFVVFLKSIRGEGILILLKVGHHRPVSETPFTTLNSGLVVL